MTKTMTIDPVTRIEGHARILFDCNDAGEVEAARFCVNELRGFERILMGMAASAMPQITARICGVCPTAHHLVAAKALDHAAGVEPPPAGKLLRELMYMGHMIHSHCLSLFVLTGPDLFFGLDAEVAARNIVGMVDAQPDIAKKALRLRSIGQKINETIGGRGIHPVTAVAGGISFKPSEAQITRLQELGNEAVALVGELGPVVKKLLVELIKKNQTLVKQMNAPSWYLGTVNQGRLNVYDGTLRALDEKGAIRAEFSAADCRDVMVERAVPTSYAKEVFLNIDGAEHMYRVGPLARINAADGMETEKAEAELAIFRKNFGRPCHNAILQIYAKLIELIGACEKAREIASDPALRGETRVAADFTGSRGVAHIEAPRGTLIHDYEIDAAGIVRRANMIVATQQNTKAINISLKAGAGDLVPDGNDQAILNRLEFVVRCYDPCLACATHAVGGMELEVEISRGGKIVRTIRRDAHAGNDRP